MWTAIGAGSGFLFLLSVVLGMQNVKINKAATKELCKERTEDFKRSLKSGNERFTKNDEILAKLNEEQVAQGKVLIEVYTIVKRMEKNNGGGE